MGLLRITGSLDVTQFYPAGQSDGDTAHLTIDPDTSFAFQESEGAEFRVTTVFSDAKVSGRDGSKLVIDKHNRIDVRFQGIDAPELHFRPTFSHLSPAQKEAVKEVNKNFRQPFGASAAIALAQFLQTPGGEQLSCSLVTQVDAPNDVCDTYARVVGDLIALVGENNETNLNRWMLENGWAFPAFYTSMTPDEIQPLRDLGAAARNSHLGFWPSFINTVEFPDPDLVFAKNVDGGGADGGPVLFPKYFRRSCNWYVSIEAGLTGSVTFEEFLALQHQPDECFLLSEFLEHSVHSAQTHLLEEFVRPDGRLTQEPDDLVFKEAKSTVRSGDGSPITSFF